MVVVASGTSRELSLASRFERLKEDWKEQSQYLSNTTQMTMLRPYQQIIGLGSSVIPLLLEELSREPDHWFWALEVLSDENPVDAEAIGNLALMTEAWLSWGRRKGLTT